MCFVILGGISIFFPTYFMVFTVKSLSRKNLQYEGVFEHRHAQASDEAGHYLILRKYICIVCHLPSLHRVLQYKHDDHVLLGHFGQNKTLALIRWEYTWPALQSFVIDFCKSYTTCLHSKSQHHWPYGTLQQLPIPKQPWNSISMDFIEQLPASSGFTAILVVVCHLTRRGTFIPTYDMITSADLTHLFILHVFLKHGVPSHVTSDRGSEFVSQFFCSLGKAGSRYESAFHLGIPSRRRRSNRTCKPNS
jgi:Integrase zinc binding domain